MSTFLICKIKRINNFSSDPKIKIKIDVRIESKPVEKFQKMRKIFQTICKNKEKFRLKSMLTVFLWFITAIFQPCSSHGTQKLVMKILWHTKNLFFDNLRKK